MTDKECLLNCLSSSSGEQVEKLLNAEIEEIVTWDCLGNSSKILKLTYDKSNINN